MKKCRFMECYIVRYTEDEAKSLDTQILVVTFQANFVPPSVGLSLAFKFCATQCGLITGF